MAAPLPGTEFPLLWGRLCTVILPLFLWNSTTILSLGDACLQLLHIHCIKINAISFRYTGIRTIGWSNSKPLWNKYHFCFTARITLHIGGGELHRDFGYP